MTLYGGVEFTGDPEERVYVSPDTVLAAMPDELEEWRRLFERIVGRSVPGEFLTKAQIYGYVLNAYAKYNLPQYFFSPITFYNASQWFLVESDLRRKDGTLDDDFEAFWRVEVTALCFTGMTGTFPNCTYNYSQERAVNTYFGKPPVLLEDPGYNQFCRPNRFLSRMVERGFEPHGVGGWRFETRCINGQVSIWLERGGIIVDVTELEVTEGGQLYVSLPELPSGVPYPPPLIGRVIDYGPPGPQGLPGPQGEQGPPGVSPSGQDLVNEICSLTEGQKDEAKDCLGIGGDFPTYLGLVFAATPLEIQQAQQIILTEAPEVVLPETQIILTETGEATLTAEAAATGGWLLVLTLPIAGLLLLKGVLATISVFDCGEDGAPTTKEMSFPVLGIGENNQRLVWQELFKQLSYLLQCCKPCEGYNWELMREASGDDIFIPTNEWKAMRLVMVENPNPEVNAWYGKADVRKLGLVRWLHAIEPHSTTGGGASSDDTLLFWNTNDQIFKKPPGDVVGFEVTQEYAKHYQVWILNRPLTASGIQL